MVYSIATVSARLTHTGRTRGRAALDGGPKSVYASLRNPPRLIKRKSLNQELFRQHVEGNKVRQRPSLSSINANIESPSSPGSRGGSPYSTHSQRGHKRHGSAIAAFEERYMKQAISTLCEAIRCRLELGTTNFCIPSDTIEFERTSLSHMQENKTFAKVCASVVNHFEGQGYLIKIRPAEQVGVADFIQAFSVSVKHASMDIADTARSTRAYSAERLAAAANTRILIID